MKILNAKISPFTKLSTAILRHLEWLVCAHHKSVEDGWRAIIELYDCDGPYFKLDVQSNRGGGNYAEAKMDMLRQFPDLRATGLESPAELAERIRICQSYPTNGTLLDAACTIATLEYIEQMPRSTAELLRDYGLTSYKGAIHVPLEIINSGDMVGIDKEPCAEGIRIAFSGAEEWQDLFFSMSILADLQQTLNRLWDEDQIWFNLRGLEGNPQTKMWLDLLDIREA